MSRLERFVESTQREILEQARGRYSETVLDHWMHPRGTGTIKAPDGHAGFTGPCGDRMEIALRVVDDVVTAACFLTDGCATTIAAASMAVELVEGRTVREAADIDQELILARLGGLPEENQHCAFLAEYTLRAALADYLRRER